MIECYLCNQEIIQEEAKEYPLATSPDDYDMKYVCGECPLPDPTMEEDGLSDFKHKSFDNQLII